MKTPRIDHIQLTVKDLAKAEQFYDRILPLLGFDLNRKSKGRVAKHEFDVIEYANASFIFGINSPRERFKNDEVHRRKPGSLHHLAFKADSVDQVDAFSASIKKMGANIVEGPQYFPQHGEKYYAVFFKDPDGIKLEVVYEER